MASRLKEKAKKTREYMYILNIKFMKMSRHFEAINRIVRVSYHLQKNHDGLQVQILQYCAIGQKTKVFYLRQYRS